MYIPNINTCHAIEVLISSIIHYHIENYSYNIADYAEAIKQNEIIAFLVDNNLG